MRKFKRDGRTSHPLYTRWKSMIQRCTDKNHAAYPRYGGRGIQVDPRWLEDFWAFVEDIGMYPDDGQRWTLDRIDNDGNYEPGNVRWSTYSEQNANRRKLNYPVPEFCRNGHKYELMKDSAGNSRCRQCVRNKNRRSSKSV